MNVFRQDSSAFVLVISRSMSGDESEASERIPAPGSCCLHLDQLTLKTISVKKANLVFKSPITTLHYTTLSTE